MDTRQSMKTQIDFIMNLGSFEHLIILSVNGHCFTVTRDEQGFNLQALISQYELGVVKLI